MKTERTLSAEEASERRIKRRTFLSFSVFTLAGAGGFGFWKWFQSLPKNADKLSIPARKMLDFNEKANNVFFSSQHLAPVYDPSEAVKKPRVNGKVGLKGTFDAKKWSLQVKEPTKSRSISLAEIKRLPKTDIVFDFKCIEGWNEIVHYGGVTLADFLHHYQLGLHPGKSASSNLSDWYSYVGLETPDGAYFVGLDIKSALHPQTILCYEMNGKELTSEHGAPLRLIIPVKYGIKNLKRIGTLFFSDERPRDYWHQKGYDYDSAL